MPRYAALLVVCGVLFGCGDRQANGTEERDHVREGATALTAPAEDGGRVRIIRLVARGDRYSFEPNEVEVRPGEVIRFVHTDNQPESVAFDTAGAPAGGVEFLAGRNLLTGPLLTVPGAVYDVSMEGAPPGTYSFFSVPHAEHGMQGRVHVTP